MSNIHTPDYPKAIKREWRKLLAVTLIVLLLALLATIVQPFKYKAAESILILQKSGFSIDAYSALKSEDRIATKLSQVVYSSSFFDQVLGSGLAIDKSYFSADEKNRRKEWAKTIEADVPSGLGKLVITVYHTDPNQALLISRAVAYELTSRKSDYIGIADVDLRVIDAPLVSKFPVKPNIFLNIILGLASGFILGIICIIVGYKPEDEKYFHCPKLSDIRPQLVDYAQIPENKSVEKDIAKAPEIAEIDDLDEIESLEEGQNTVLSVSDEIPVPSIANEFENKKEERFEIKKELPKFDDEDKIVGMPDHK